MEIKSFTKKVQKALGEALGDDYEVMVQEVEKNNGVLLHGVTIASKEKNISPTIYLEPFFEEYEKGETLSSIVDKITDIYERDTPANSVDMSFFRSFDKVKDRICFRLINADLNKNLLEKIPYMSYFDLAICFYYAYEDEQLGEGAILIYNSHMKVWNTNTEELYAWARFNTQKLFPASFMTTNFLLRDLMGMSETEVSDDELFEVLPMEIVSSENRTLGSAVILYPGFTEYLAGRLKGSYYILPSSIHEVIILRDSPNVDHEQLKRMVSEVNGTLVSKEEILSDSVYFFDADRYELKML